MSINPNSNNHPQEYNMNMVASNLSINPPFLFQHNLQMTATSLAHMTLQNQLNNLPQIISNQQSTLNSPSDALPIVDQIDNIDNQISPQTADTTPQEKNVYNYSTTSPLYSISFQNSDKCRLAIGTLDTTNIHNRIEILELINNDLTAVTMEDIEYPSTKLLWGPTQSKSDLLASSSDCMRLYQMDDKDNERKLLLKVALHNKKSKYCGPLTSFDWNKANDSILGTASIDTTCAIWDLNKGTIRTQLIAHEKEVFDISFSNEEHVFISSGADGSIRLFDLRELDHSTIIYETKDQTPITKIAWNMNNKHLISALSWEKNVVYIFDSRVANVSLVELKFHKLPVTGMAWSPNHHTQICSVSEDKNVIITYVPNEAIQNNNVCYVAPNEISNVSWCQTLPEWIGITFQKQVQMLRK